MRVALRLRQADIEPRHRFHSSPKSAITVSHAGLASVFMRARGAILAATAVAVAGCAHTVERRAGVHRRRADHPAAPDDTGQVLVTAAQVSDIVGARLQVDADQARPVSGSSAVPACSALDSVGMAAFVGDGWSGFRVLLFTDGERHDRVVAEAVAVYPDARSAAAAFATGTSDVKACDGQRALSTGSGAAWKFGVHDDDTDTVRWTKQQLAIPLDLGVPRRGQASHNAVLQAMACQDDDGGETVVTSLTDRMSASVWELSGR